VDDDAPPDDRDGLVARHRMDGPEPDLERAVAAVLDALAPGDVVAYGEVAAEAGWPGRSRAVGRVLATSDGAHPWWRVVNASGRLVPGHEADQARRLAEEGVEVRDGRVRPPTAPPRRDRPSAG
jgi:methylated-DNA-protein-cysteine methyltransferase-like protein